MKINRKHGLALLAGAAVLATGMAQAKVSAQDAAKLGQSLTPVGAEKAGNAAGTIPAWDGGLAPRSDAFDPVAGYKDPFAADQPLFVITAANVEQYRDKLTPGQLALFQHSGHFADKIRF
mgnify:CR=1 FL=1